MRNVLLVVVALALMAGSAMAQSTVRIRVDPGGMAAAYTIAGQASKKDHEYDVAPGRHLFHVGPGLGFFFAVAGTGEITVENPVAAQPVKDMVANLWVLTLANRTVAVDRAAYPGAYGIRHVPAPPESLGVRRYTLVPGLGRYTVQFAPGTGFQFTLAADGTVTPENPATSVGSPDRLTFRTTTLAVDPAAYPGNWWIGGAEAPYGKPGSRDVIAVPGVAAYYLGFAAGSSFRFDLDDRGRLAAIPPGTATGTGTDRLVLSTVRLDVRPENPATPWRVNGVESTWRAGARTLTIVPGVSGYDISVTYSTAGEFALDATGQPQPGTVFVAHGTTLHAFFLGAPQVRCRFAASGTLRDDIPGNLTKGDLVQVDGDLLIDLTPTYADTSQKHFAWTGHMRFAFPATGDGLEGTSGGVYVLDDLASLDRMGVAITNATGTAGGHPVGPTNSRIQLLGALDVLATPDLPTTATVWNAFRTTRLGSFTLAGVFRPAHFDLGDVTLSGGACN